MPQARLKPKAAFALCVAALLVAIGVLLGDSLFGGKILSQADALEAFSPWSDSASEPAEPQNALLLDQSIVMQPWQHFAAERLHHGTPPLWNPDNYLGQPMVGTYQSAYFWPLHWVYYLWPSDSFWGWSAALRLLLAGVFTYWFVRELGLGAGPATIGAAAFALSGFMIAWLGHMHTHVALFLPALLWQVERIAQRPGRSRDIAWLALMVAGALLAGHLQTAVHIAIAVALYVGFRTVAGEQRLGRRGWGQVLAGAGLGVLLALPQVLPFFDYLKDSSGALVLEDIQTVSEVNPLDPAVLMIDPSHFGSPAAAQNYGKYVGPEGANLNYSELIGGYVGRFALLLALLGGFCAWRRSDPRARRMLAFFGGLALLSAAIAWQVWPVYDLFAAVPKLKSTKLMRFSLILALSLAVLAAYGAEWLLARRSPRWRAVLSVAMVALVAAELVAFGHGYNPAIDPADKAPATAVTNFLRGHLPADYSQATWRVLSIEKQTLIPSANLYYDIPVVSGYDSMELRTTTELVALMSSSPEATAYKGQAAFLAAIPYFDQGWSIANLLGVRFVLSKIALPAPLELRLDGPTRVYENPLALPRVFAAARIQVIPGKVERLAALRSETFDPGVAILERAPHGINAAVPLARAQVQLARYTDLAIDLAVEVADAPQPALIVLTDAWDDGWVATLDGQAVPIERVDHGLRGVWVPSGAHQIALRYRPASLTWGLGLAGLALLVCIKLLIPARKSKNLATESGS